MTLPPLDNQKYQREVRVAVAQHAGPFRADNVVTPKVTEGAGGASASVVSLSQGDLLKTFTIDEAQSLLPLMESLLKRAIEGKRAAQEIEAQIAELGRRIYLAGGMRVNVAEVGRQRTEMDAHLQRVRESIAEIDSIGVQVKDVETGLLDFPCRIDDQVVLLCWRMGETSIEHWHTVEDGFRGRKPVDDRFRRRSNSSNNRPN
jgi:hypothetical protein